MKTFKLTIGCSIILLLLGCKDNSKASIEELYLPDINRLFEPYEEVERTRDFKAFAEKLLDANRDLQSAQLFVETASLFHRAGETEMAITTLHRAIDKGLSNPKILARFEGIRQKLDQQEGQRLLKRLDSISDQLRDVEHFSLEMEAMNQFWPYFEKAKNDTANAKLIFKEYLFRGPQEIRDFYVVRYINLDNMYGQMINATPDYYTYLEDQFKADSLTALNSRTKSWMRNFKKLYPQAVFPKVYVVPGILNSGGTTTEMGMFVGGDMYGKSAEMPTDGLSDWQKGAIMQFDDLPGLTIHELMHFQQSYGDTVNSDNVLAGIIGEGVCDFLVELCSGIPLQNDNLHYLEEPENREFILSELKEDLFRSDNSKWLYNGGAIEDRPHDLGYTLGYLITKSYYQNQNDKQKAVYELLNTSDFRNILKESDFGYLLETKIQS